MNTPKPAYVKTSGWALQKEQQSKLHNDGFDRVRNLECEIVRVDEEIDRRVYALYGLMEEEIRVVEGK